jgi:hypothetical protein
MHTGRLRKQYVQHTHLPAQGSMGQAISTNLETNKYHIMSRFLVPESTVRCQVEKSTTSN